MRLSLFALGLLLATGAAFGQPRIDLVQNNYSYLLPDNPNYGIAQGSIVLITGKNLANFSTPLQNVPLKTNLNGVSGQVTVNNVSRDLILYYVTPTAIGAIIPSSTPTGKGALVISNGQAGASIPVTIVQSALGVLTLDGSGTGRAVATDANFNLLTPEHPAKPGDTIVLFGTGLGPVLGDETITQVQVSVGSLNNIATSTIGGLGASIKFAGRTIYPGLDQINVTIPKDGPAPISVPGLPGIQGLSGNMLGCNVAVVFNTNSGQFRPRSNTVTIPVSADGSACKDPVIPSGGTVDPTIRQTEVNQWITAGQYRFGSIALSRSISYQADPQGATPGLVARGSDGLSGQFQKFTGSDLSRYLNGLLTPKVSVLGTCGATISSDSASTFPNLIPTLLDGGTAVGVNSVNGLRAAAPHPVSISVLGSAASSSGTIFSADIGSTAAHDYLDAGRYTLFEPGGPDVGAFSGDIDFSGADLKWTNRESLQTITRSNGLTITWTGGGDPTAMITISGGSNLTTPGVSGSSTTFTTSASSFACYASVADGHFTVPASILTQLYATQVDPQTPPTPDTVHYGSLGISISKTVRMQAAGLDYVTGTVSQSIGQSTFWK